ncbi:MAG: choice-of-anchor E domain-containing protein [Phycisphaerae bacterium]|nr:choice-of-anchor E domain-containing protein [Phycisphaerae bacterium]
MKNTVLALGMVLAASAGAQASFSEMEMQLQEWSFPLSPGNTQVQFQQFDTQGGTRILKAVSVEMEGKISALITAENNSTIDANDFAVSVTGIIDFSIANASLGLGINAVSSPIPVTATDNGGLPNGMGPDFADFGMVMGSDTDSALVFPFPPPGLLPWIGNGVVIGTISGSGGFAAQGSADASINFDDFGAFGTAKVTYFFDVVPTPGSMALIGLAGLAAVRRRRI